MQRIEGSTIKLNRGDVMNITLTLKTLDGSDYTFQNGDKIVFSVYNKNKMDEEAVLLKEVDVLEQQESVIISLSSEETKIGELINKPVDYWYEVELNGEYTVIGYDDDGAKILRLYPEGSKMTE